MLSKTRLLEICHEAAIREVTEDFSYLFQSFTSKPDELKFIFEQMQNGEELYDAIRPIYDLKCDPSITYFIPPIKRCEASSFTQLGVDLIDSLKKLPIHAELAEMIENISLVSHREIKNSDFENDSFIIFYEILGDYLSSLFSDTETELLKEAYYSIANDYFLACYFRWADLRGSEENLLTPYYKIWKQGYSIAFVDREMIIGATSST